MRKLTGLLLVLTLLCFSCASKEPVDTQPKLTPEQVFAKVKTDVVSTANWLGLLITEIEKKPDANQERLRILKVVKGLLDEFIRAVADVTVIDLSNREAIGRAIDKVLASADRLIAGEVIRIADPNVKGELSNAIFLVRSAVQAVRLLLPAEANQ